MTASGADPDHREAARRRARRLGLDRLGVFVPAVMSVGIVFWIVTEVRDLVRARGRQSRSTRSDVAGLAVAGSVLDRQPRVAPGLRPRAVYLLVGLALTGAAAYVAVGSTANFFRESGYVEGIAWLLALSIGASFVALVYAYTSFATYLSWLRPPAWARGILLWSPLGASTVDPHAEGRPSWILGSLLAMATAAAGVLAALVAFSPQIIEKLNARITEWFTRHTSLAPSILLSAKGAFVLTVVIGLVAAGVALRCHVLVAYYAVAIAAALISGGVLRLLVARTGAATDHIIGDLDTFPDISLTLLVLVAGLFPLSLHVVLRRFWIVHMTRAVLGMLVGLHAVRVVAAGELTTDVCGGVLIGLVLVLVGQYMIDNQLWHGSCDACPWSAHPYDGPARNAVPLRPTRRQVLTLATTASAVAVSVLVLSSDVDVATQVALMGLTMAGTLTAWRWRRVGAVLGGTAVIGAGILAGREHAMWTSVVLTVALLTPYLALLLNRRSRHDLPDTAR